MSAVVRPQESRPISVRLADGERPERVFAPVDGEQFVRAVFDGAIGDGPPFATPLDAECAVRAALASRFRRSLTGSELSYVDMLTAMEWNRRDYGARRV